MHKRWLKFFCVTFLAAMIAGFGKDAIAYVSKTIDRSAKQIENPERETENSKRTRIQSANENLLGDRSTSDAGRIVQVEEVAERITVLSVLIGHGFGMGIPARPVHMEISYLEIFHKQGIIGLLFWGVLLFMLIKKYMAAVPSQMGDAFFFSSVFVFFQSLTNQFINNPIGLSITLLSLVALDHLKKTNSDNILTTETE
jgi:hypothetical protein